MFEDLYNFFFVGIETELLVITKKSEGFLFVISINIELFTFVFFVAFEIRICTNLLGKITKMENSSISIKSELI